MLSSGLQDGLDTHGFAVNLFRKQPGGNQSLLPGKKGKDERK